MAYPTIFKLKYDCDVKYTIVDDHAYTEDNILIYNIFLYAVSNEFSNEQMYEYFRKFGEISKINFLRNRKNQRVVSGFVHFVDPKSVVSVLRQNMHGFNDINFRVQASYSWQQPDGKNIMSLISNQLKSNHMTVYNSSDNLHKASILNLNDDCLEYICKYLSLNDQLNFALTCRRFLEIFKMLSSYRYKHLSVSKLLAVSPWKMKLFLEIAGPSVKSIYCQGVPSSNEKCDELLLYKLLGSHCTNVNAFKIDSLSLDLYRVRLLLGKMKLLTNLSLRRVGLEDKTLGFIKTFPDLKSLFLAYNRRLTGKHIKDIGNLKELCLHNCRSIQPVHFKNIFKSLRDLSFLDISSCNHLKAVDYEEIANNLLQLESLKLSSTSESFACIARLPKLKKLGIHSEYGSDLELLEFYESLAEHGSEQLEVLHISGSRVINPQKASILSRLKKLKVLRCYRKAVVDDQCLKYFSHLTKLETLDVRYCDEITTEGILYILKNCRELKHLDISFCSELLSLYDMIEVVKKLYESNLRNHCLNVYVNISDIKLSFLLNPEIFAVSDSLRICNFKKSPKSLDFPDNDLNSSDLHPHVPQTDLFNYLYNMSKMMYDDIKKNIYFFKLFYKKDDDDFPVIGRINRFDDRGLDDLHPSPSYRCVCL